MPSSSKQMRHRAEPERRCPPYLVFMLLLTGAYLSLEVPFSAHLLDVLGGDPTPDDISTMEHFGRVLSGFAVAIAVIGAMLPKRQGRPFMATVFVTGVAGLASVVVTFFALNALAEGIGHMAGAEARRDAVRTMLARRALIDGIGSPTGLPADAVNTPEWKAFVSIAPALGQSNGALLKFVNAPTVKLVSRDAETKVGDPGEVRKAVFGTGFQAIRDAFLSYSNAGNSYRAADQRWREQADEAWEKYWRQRQALYQPRLNNIQIAEIRGRIQRKGAPVPNDWHPDDKRGFYAAIRSKVMTDVDKAYGEGMERALGKGRSIPAGLTFDQFLKTDAVQRKVREDLGFPAKPGPVIRPEMNDAEFLRAVIEPMRTKAGEATVDMVTADPRKFAAGGEFEEAGIEAVKAVYVPALALVLSLAGAIGHLFKFTWLLAALGGSLFRAKRVLTMKVAAASLVTGVMGMWLTAPANAVTSSTGFATIRSYAEAGVGARIADLLVSAIDVQQRFQPLGHKMGEYGAFHLVRAHLPAARAIGQKA